MSILKVDYSGSIFFQISYSFVPKIEICVKYFLDKNSPKQPWCCLSIFFPGDLSQSQKISEIKPPLKSLGGRSKSQDAIRNHRKTVRFVSDKQQYQPILDSTNIGGYNGGGGSRPNGRGELGHSGPGGPGSGGGGVKGRSFFLLSMLQGGDPSSSSGRAKSSKVTTFLHFFFSLFFFAWCHQSLLCAAPLHYYALLLHSLTA